MRTESLDAHNSSGQPQLRPKISGGGIFFLCLPWIIGLVLITMELYQAGYWSHAIKLPGVVVAKRETRGFVRTPPSYYVRVRLPSGQTSRDIEVSDYSVWQRMSQGDRITLSYLPAIDADVNGLFEVNLRVEGQEYPHTAAAGFFFWLLGALLIAGLLYTQHKYW